MARNLDPKCKQCRRAGEKLFLKGERCFTPKCAIVRRNYPPGIHGVKGGKKKLTEYGFQLREKQKAKKEYGLMEDQFKLTFKKAQKQKGDTSENFLKLLETRLDNVVYRLGFASSRNQARILVSHGHFLVDDKKVNIPSYNLKKGDIIKIKQSSQRKKIFNILPEKLKKTEAPGWLNLDAKELTGKILHSPMLNEIKTNIDAQAVIGFYSR
jgi:small subunit ribosomal protein S4